MSREATKQHTAFSKHDARLMYCTFGARHLFLAQTLRTSKAAFRTPTFSSHVLCLMMEHMPFDTV